MQAGPGGASQHVCNDVLGTGQRMRMLLRAMCLEAEGSTTWRVQGLPHPRFPRTHHSPPIPSCSEPQEARQVWLPAVRSLGAAVPLYTSNPPPQPPTPGPHPPSLHPQSHPCSEPQEAGQVGLSVVPRGGALALGAAAAGAAGHRREPGVLVPRRGGGAQGGGAGAGDGRLQGGESRPRWEAGGVGCGVGGGSGQVRGACRGSGVSERQPMQ